MVGSAPYTVLWTTRAESQLAAMWSAATDRPSITTAANSLDADLAADPHSLGESRADSYRIEVRGVLAVIYAVSDPDRTVTVVRVWRVAQPG